MRRVRSDVSHRIRRRPSIFSTPWFRIAFGVGVLLVVALLVGPSVASWFGGDLPRGHVAIEVLDVRLGPVAADGLPPPRCDGGVAEQGADVVLLVQPHRSASLGGAERDAACGEGGDKRAGRSARPEVDRRSGPV